MKQSQFIMNNSKLFYHFFHYVLAIHCSIEPPTVEKHFLQVEQWQWATPMGNEVKTLEYTYDVLVWE